MHHEPEHLDQQKAAYCFDNLRLGLDRLRRRLLVQHRPGFHRRELDHGIHAGCALLCPAACRASLFVCCWADGGARLAPRSCSIGCRSPPRALYRGDVRSLKRAGAYEYRFVRPWRPRFRPRSLRRWSCHRLACQATPKPLIPGRFSALLAHLLPPRSKTPEGACGARGKTAEGAARSGLGAVRRVTATDGARLPTCGLELCAPAGGGTRSGGGRPLAGCRSNGVRQTRPPWRDTVFGSTLRRHGLANGVRNATALPARGAEAPTLAAQRTSDLGREEPAYAARISRNENMDSSNNGNAHMTGLLRACI